MSSTSVSSKRSSRSNTRTSRASSRWVRKNILMDQTKLDVVKRLLKAPTETEAVNAALDEIAFRHGLVSGVRAIRRAGGLTDLFDER